MQYIELAYMQPQMVIRDSEVATAKLLGRWDTCRRF